MLCLSCLFGIAFVVDLLQCDLLRLYAGIDHPFTTYDEENVQQVRLHQVCFVSERGRFQFIDLLDKDEISEGATKTETDTAMQE